MARYAQAAQYEKVATWIPALAGTSEATVIASAQSVTDMDVYLTSYRFLYGGGGYQYYVGGPRESLLTPFNTWDWYRDPGSERSGYPPYFPDKAGPSFNKRIVNAAFLSILIRGLPREWENDGALAQATEWEAAFLARWGVAYDAELHEGGVCKGIMNGPHGTRPRGAVAWYESIPDADDIADVLYQPFESLIPYSSL